MTQVALTLDDARDQLARDCIRVAMGDIDCAAALMVTELRIRDITEAPDGTPYTIADVTAAMKRMH